VRRIWTLSRFFHNDNTRFSNAFSVHTPPSVISDCSLSSQAPAGEGEKKRTVLISVPTTHKMLLRKTGESCLRLYDPFLPERLLPAQPRRRINRL
jgi:hypothetical protein